MERANSTALAMVLLSYLAIGLMFMGYAAPTASAQVLYGSIVGTVTDQTGAVVPKVVVTVTNTSTGLSRQATTDDGGYYSIPNLLEGTYNLSISASGFKPYTQKNVNVPINAVTRADANLQVGGVTEAINVEASAAVLQTTKADVSVNLEARAIENLPLSNFRNYQSLINLVPGATPARFQNAEADTPGRSLSTNINGQQRGANNTRLDGSADILVTMPHHAVYVPPVESIAEVNISTNNFDAEQGMTGGAAITVVTKSGTNDFHGSLFAFHNNSATRAFLWDENRNGVRRKPKSILNVDGGSIGGPIKKNKLFFFADWEGTFERANRFVQASVPADDLRMGDFTRVFGNTTPKIFDPYTGNADGTNRTPFSFGKVNVIPPARLNGPMLKLLDLVPHPNQPGRDTLNYYNSGTQRLNRNNIDSKINWNRNDKHQLWFKYSVMRATFSSAGFSLGGAGGACLCDGGLGQTATLTQIAAIGQTYTVSPTFVIDATLGWTRFGQAAEPPDLGTNFGSDVLKIPGTNGPDRRESGMPRFVISGYSDLGNPEGWNPAYRNDQSYTFNANANWMRGAHEIRFGFDFVHHLMNHWQPELGRGPRGGFTFGKDLTSIRGSRGNEFNALAAFLIGAPQSSGKSSQYIKMDSLENQYAFYVRDRWRATPKLTLNAGLRWELYPNRRRSQGLGIESYDPTTNEALIGGRGSIPRDNGVGWSKKLFAPRIGFAYQLTNSTVIRSGYGITYHSHPWGAQALRGWFPLTVVGEFAGINGFQPVTTDPNYVAALVPNAPLGPNVGIPSICCPDISTGRVQLPNAAEDGYPAANTLLRRGYIQSWNFIIERRLPGELVTSVGYVGSADVRDLAFRNINASQTPNSGNIGRPLFKFGRTASTRLWDGMLNGNYHSLQATLNRRFPGGLFLKGAYTYSRAINMAEYGDWTETLWPANIVWGRNRAPANFNIPHVFQFAYMYELPFGSGKRWAASGPSKAVLGGWQVNGTFSAFQGLQYTLTDSGSLLNMPGNQQTPDQVKPVVATLGLVGDDGTWFDTTALAPVKDVRFGTVGRNTMRGPGVVNTDLGLLRTFKLTEKFNLQFRAESFNLSNTPAFANPNGDSTSVDFGKVLSTRSGTARTGLARSREFRFGLRLNF